MSDKDTDSRWDEAAREKALEERDNKPVLEFDFEKYVVHQVHLHEMGEINTAVFISNVCEAVDIMENEEACAEQIMQLEDQWKQLDNRQRTCTLQLRKLMMGL